MDDAKRFKLTGTNTFRESEIIDAIVSHEKKSKRKCLDLVTDLAVENLEKESCGLMKERDWKIMINGASLHPEYAMSKDIQEQLKFEMKSSMKGNNGDAEAREGIERRNRARQSPYPTFIIEVKASSPSKRDDIPLCMPTFEGESLDNVIQKLESIYSMSAALHTKSGSNKDDIFYNAIGMINGIEEIIPTNSVCAGVQDWVMKNDEKYLSNLSTFASTNLQHTDSAFEFVFTNLSMHKYDPDDPESSSQITGQKMSFKPSLRSYLIMPKFVTSSATSFETFADCIKSIILSIDGLNDRVSISILHPEHIDRAKRSPAPVIILQWYEKNE